MQKVCRLTEPTLVVIKGCPTVQEKDRILLCGNIVVVVIVIIMVTLLVHFNKILTSLRA